SNFFPSIFPNVEDLSVGYVISAAQRRTNPSLAMELANSIVKELEGVIKESSPPLFRCIRKYRCNYRWNHENYLGRHMEEYKEYRDFWDEKLGLGKYANED